MLMGVVGTPRATGHQLYNPLIKLSHPAMYPAPSDVTAYSTREDLAGFRETHYVIQISVCISRTGCYPNRI